MKTTEQSVENTELDVDLTPEGADMQQQIANLAYALWQQHGEPVGTSEQDWSEAENQLRVWGEKLTAAAR